MFVLKHMFSVVVVPIIAADVVVDIVFIKVSIYFLKNEHFYNF